MAWRCHCFIFFGSFGRDLPGQRRVGRNRRPLSRLYWRGVSNSQTVRNRCGLSSALPRLMIFSKDKRFEVRGDYLAERTIRSIKSATDGGFQITETFANRWRPFSKRQGFKLQVVGPTTIEITEGKARTRFFKCSSGSSSL